MILLSSSILFLNFRTNFVEIGRGTVPYMQSFMYAPLDESLQFDINFLSIGAGWSDAVFEFPESAGIVLSL